MPAAQLSQDTGLAPVQPTAQASRNRARLAAGIVATIALGLASRQYRGLFPASLENYPGDALWALVLFQTIAFIKPDISLPRLTRSTMAIAFLIELSQLYQAPWMNAIRNTVPGHLLLGSSFIWQDLCAYTAGVAIGVLLDWLMLQSR